MSGTIHSLTHETSFVVLSYGEEHIYRGAGKSLARPSSPCILFDGESISFDASLVIYKSILLIFLQV